MSLKLNVLLTAVAASFAATAFSYVKIDQAGLPFSISANAGANFMSLTQKSKAVNRDVGYVLGAALGYNLTPHWQTTVSYDYIVNTGHAKAKDMLTLVLVNGYYNFRGLLPNISQLVPFVGVGLGYVDLSETDGTYGTINSAGFAYRVALGADYYVTPEFALGAAYKFTGTSINYGKINSDFLNNSIVAHISYYFG